MPEGVAPTGPAAAASGVRVLPLTVKPVTASAPDSTTQSVLPSGGRRAFSAPAPIWPAPVLWRKVRVPPAPIELVEVDAEAELAANREVSWWLSTIQPVGA